MSSALDAAATPSLAPRTAIVTGAARGIGTRIAERLALAGARVAVWDVDAKGAQQVADRLRAEQGEAAGVPCDVSDPSQVTSAMEKTVQQLGVPTLAVTAAGIIRVAPFLELQAAEFTSELAVNLTGTFLTVQACARAMAEKQLPGAIVCIASVAGRGPRADSAGYAASKAGVISVVRSAALALAGKRIRVNAVCPGVVDTEMTQRIAAARASERGISVQEALQPLVDRIPLGRVQSTDDVADVAMFLLSEAASYVTGQALNACGGLEFD